MLICRGRVPEKKERDGKKGERELAGERIRKTNLQRQRQAAKIKVPKKKLTSFRGGMARTRLAAIREIDPKRKGGGGRRAERLKTGGKEEIEMLKKKEKGEEGTQQERQKLQKSHAKKEAKKGVARMIKKDLNCSGRS